MLDIERAESAWRRERVGVGMLPGSDASGYEGRRKEPVEEDLAGREKVRSTLGFLESKLFVASESISERFVALNMSWSRLRLPLLLRRPGDSFLREHWSRGGSAELKLGM